jgi:stage V sporulation protein R
MAEQIGMLLLNFGINYGFSEKNKPGYTPNFHLTITGKPNVWAFAKHVGFYGSPKKEECCKRILEFNENKYGENVWYVYAKVIDKSQGYDVLYDITVPGTHHYLAQACINHNSYWHAELMHQYFLGNDNDYGAKGIQHPLTSEEHLDFLSSHEKVVQPGLKMKLKIDQPEVDAYGRPTGRLVKTWDPRIVENPNLFHYATRINPYYVGFRMFRDIKDRWDEYHKQGYYEDEWGTKTPVTVDGAQKIREVMESEDDVSFFRNYLTEELCDELHLFAYGSPEDYKDDYKIQEEIEKRVRDNGEEHIGSLPIDEQFKINKTLQVRTKNIKDVISSLARTKNNYGVPCIEVRRVDSDGTLRLEHGKDDLTNVDIKYGEQTLAYVFRVWGRPVELIRKDTDHTDLMKIDATGFSVDHATADYPECIEEKDAASSW